MAKRTNLKQSPNETLAEIVTSLHGKTSEKTTHAAGIKDLGEAGDVVWRRADGGEDSVRTTSENLEAARKSIAELNKVTLPKLADDLEQSRSELEQKLNAANARIDDIVVDNGGAGNFTTYSINEPDAAGTGEGDQWFRVVDGEVIGQWRWDGSAWQAVTLTDTIISGIDLSKLEPRGSLSEVVANKMFADIFAANKVTTQELAAGAVTAENLAVGAVKANMIEGGSFVGETFEGGTFTGGLFKTSDALPGQVVFADNAYTPSAYNGSVARPGFRIVPPEHLDLLVPPGIGPDDGGVTVDGGQTVTGVSSRVEVNALGAKVETQLKGDYSASKITTDQDESALRRYAGLGALSSEIIASSGMSTMRAYREDGHLGANIKVTSELARMASIEGEGGGVIKVSSDSSEVLAYSEDGREVAEVEASSKGAKLSYRNLDGGPSSWIEANSDEAFIHASIGGVNRYLEVDARGIWVKTDRDGKYQKYNLEETANDSGWIRFNAHSGISTGNDPGLRLKGGIVWAQGYVTRPAGWPKGWTRIAGSFAEWLRPTRDILRQGATTATQRQILRMTSTGYIEVWWSDAAPGAYQVDLSPLSFPNS